jgi:hypothetical protein
MTKEECEEAARKDYERHLGLILAADKIVGTDGTREVAIYGATPIYVRIVGTNPDNLQIWDENCLRPSWQCEIVAEVDNDLVSFSDDESLNVRIEDFRTFFVDGLEYSLDAEKSTTPFPPWAYAGNQDENLSDTAKETLENVDWQNRVKKAQEVRKIRGFEIFDDGYIKHKVNTILREFYDRIFRRMDED